MTEIAEKSSPFITGEDTFDVSVNYYRDGNKVIVEGNEIFDIKRQSSAIGFTIRYPSQADCEIIMKSCKDIYIENVDNLDIRKFMKVELVRFLTLVKKWDVDEVMSNETIMRLHPDIIRVSLIKIRDEIGTNGIF